jgi:hypothetical protein
MLVSSLSDADKVLQHAADLGSTRLRPGMHSQLKYTSDKENERALYDLLVEACVALKFEAASVEHVGGHKFPDIVFPSANVGVEVKCHEKPGDILGNSVIASTFAMESPVAIRLLVWTKSERSIEVHDYFESVVDAKVTHSPRWLLRPGASNDERIFGTGPNHVGTVADICLGVNGINYELVIGWMRDREVRAGRVPWWIDVDKEDAPGKSVAPGLSLRRFSELSLEEREDLESVATFLYPEVMGDQSPRKYIRAIEWGVSSRNVLLSRDNFSASGKTDVKLSEVCSHHAFRVPRSFGLGILRLSRGVEVDLREVRNYWGMGSLASRTVAWAFAAALEKVSFDGVADEVAASLCRRCLGSRDDLVGLLKKTIIDELNVSVL